MELRDARKINSKELYDRRKLAVLLFEKGLKRYEIVPLVGVSAYTVSQWIKAWKKGGQAALKVGNKGRPRGLYRKLLPHEEREIRACNHGLLSRSAEIAICTLDSTSGANSDQTEIFCGFELAGGQQLLEYAGLFPAKADSTGV